PPIWSRSCPQAAHSEGKTTASTGAASRRAIEDAWARSMELELSRLLLFLAREAKARPRHGLEPLEVHVVLAGGADAEAARLDAHDRLVHLLQHVALGVGQAEQEFLGVGVRGFVGDVLRGLAVGLLAVALVLVVGLEDLLLL